jgi:nitrate/TMAO reductase-like tetraheme cytochrome c subunit
MLKLFYENKIEICRKSQNRKVSKLVPQRQMKNQGKYFKFLVMVLIGVIAILASGYGVQSYTNSPSFCRSCHEMAPEYTTYTQTAHNQISCVQCHDKPGISNIIDNKKNLVKAISSHYKDDIPKQILQTNVQIVSSENCLKCHSKNRLVTATGDLKVNHPGHIKQGIPCITCHEGVAHAKIAARGLNTEKDRNKWTETNAKKLTEEQYTKPNMGTCIDCHDKVNNGEQPWKDISYSMPSYSDASKEDESQKTQRLILQAIGKKKANVKISMECTTCHKIVKVPELHKNAAWPVNHGSTAMQELDQCLNCHQDTKWIKKVPQEDMRSLLQTENHKAKYTPNYEQVKVQSRTNKFCSTCHSSRPPSHSETVWATEHVLASSEETERQKCFICHDEKEKSTTVKAPAVSCQSCHKYFE